MELPGFKLSSFEILINNGRPYVKIAKIGASSLLMHMEFNVGVKNGYTTKVQTPILFLVVRFGEEGKPAFKTFTNRGPFKEFNGRYLNKVVIPLCSPGPWPFIEKRMADQQVIARLYSWLKNSVQAAKANILLSEQTFVDYVASLTEMFPTEDPTKFQDPTVIGEKPLIKPDNESTSDSPKKPKGGPPKQATGFQEFDEDSNSED